MASTTAFIALAGIALNEAASVPLYRQLYETLRSAVLSGRLGPGTRLPSSRTLASNLGVSRNTVATAYDQLRMEGYFEGRVGSGTFVSRALPKLRGRGTGSEQRRIARRFAQQERLSQRGIQITNLWQVIGRDAYQSHAFRPRLPASAEFPLDTWSRLTGRRWRNMPSDLLTYGDPAGYRPLREVIASFLNETRHITCEADQVIIVSGTPQAFSLAAAVLLERGEAVWMEDPGYPRARATFIAADAHLIPVPLDSEGLDLEEGMARAPHARMAYVTPSQQYPMGMTMSPGRRLELLQWAERTGAWLLEDDYGAEYRAPGLPLMAMQQAEEAGCVLFTGSFSSVLFPALRIGYLIVPPDLVDAFMAARMLMDQCPPLFGQVVLTDFIGENHLERHIRRMRGLYQQRYEVLREALEHAFGRFLEVEVEEPGLHLVARLPEGLDDQQLSRHIAQHGIEAPPLSFYAIEALGRGGFVLGYAAVDEETIRISVGRMQRALEAYSESS